MKCPYDNEELKITSFYSSSGHIRNELFCTRCNKRWVEEMTKYEYTFKEKPEDK